MTKLTNYSHLLDSIYHCFKGSFNWQQHTFQPTLLLEFPPKMLSCIQTWLLKQFHPLVGWETIACTTLSIGSVAKRLALIKHKQNEDLRCDEGKLTFFLRARYIFTRFVFDYETKSFPDRKSFSENLFYRSSLLLHETNWGVSLRTWFSGFYDDVWRSYPAANVTVGARFLCY